MDLEATVADVQRTLRQLLEDLTGQRPPIAEPRNIPEAYPTDGLGYSQFNELLLLFGYDRVTHAFFQFLCDGTLDYKIGCALTSLQELEAGVERSRKLSLLFFGNVKFGFKRLARDADELFRYRAAMLPVDTESFEKRHRAVVPLQEISSDETYYLGYVVQGELKNRLEKNPEDADALCQMRAVEAVREKGIRNQHAYLVSDHLDVYVATSMRQRHEYAEVADFARAVFTHDRIRTLNLRYFDPTQAFCYDRIDKGLAEALMLRRAQCTLYLAQESDTLGKDSELASTLAQGKPVIAYVPSPTNEDVLGSVERLSALYGRTKEAIVLERLQALSPTLAWTNGEVRRWLDEPGEIDWDRAAALLVETAKRHYDKRADTLRKDHPLGVQVHLETGVANGVLVVRSVNECAELIFRIVTGNLEFRISKELINGVEYHMLRETVSDSIFRVMTGDAMLSNCFWNFYLEPSE
ncbi:MAG: hypothetical protein LAQ30_18400 [Acidobacteriia bacterium]|nr:hypothetical protein [Terriglobia bacterium]